MTKGDDRVFTVLADDLDDALTKARAHLGWNDKAIFKVIERPKDGPPRKVCC